MNNAMPMPQPLKVTQEDQYSYVFELLVSRDLVYFPGHFPTQSVLPGVAVIDWCMNLASEYFGIAPDFESMETIKFKKLVTPDTVITINLKYQPEKCKLQFQVSSVAGEHSSGKIIVSPQQAGQ